MEPACRGAQWQKVQKCDKKWREGQPCCDTSSAQVISFLMSSLFVQPTYLQMVSVVALQTTGLYDTPDKSYCTQSIFIGPRSPGPIYVSAIR